MDKKDIANREKEKINNSEQIDILGLLGINIDDGKIEVDTNKTKSFFETLGKKVEEKVEDINSGIKSGKLDLKDSVGVKIEDEKIELDLNKTKSFFEHLANKLKSFTENIDLSTKNMNKK